MTFILKRIDGKEDFYTTKRFKNYDETYDFLEKILGEACCSDTDFENDFYYYITKINN
tara:strand:- start:375 stop:548 length:174 start_codon:yes stop_codon:yes gene_type:complete